MKKILKILLLSLIPIILIIGFFALHIFFYDPFLKFAPKNTIFYTYTNLSPLTIPRANFNSMLKDREDIKNDLSTFFDQENIEKIKKFYKTKAALIIEQKDENINFYIGLQLKTKKYKNEDYNLNLEKIKQTIRKSINKNTDLYSFESNNFIFFTNNKNYENFLNEEKYKFYYSLAKELFKNNQLYYFINNKFLRGYADVEFLKTYFNDYLDQNVFKKDYVLFDTNYNGKNVNFSVNNIVKNFSKLDNYNIKNIDEPFITINNFNIDNFLQKSFNLISDQNIVENIKNIEKYLYDEDFEYKNIAKLFNNDSNIFLEFDKETNIKNIKNFTILLDIKKVSDYYNEIKNFEKIFLREHAKSNPSERDLYLPDGKVVKEQYLDYEKSKFLSLILKDLEINQDIKYLDLKTYRIYYSIIYDKNIMVITNSEENLKNLYYSKQEDLLNINNKIKIKNKGNVLEVLF